MQNISLVDGCSIHSGFELTGRILCDIVMIVGMHEPQMHPSSYILHSVRFICISMALLSSGLSRLPWRQTVADFMP